MGLQLELPLTEIYNVKVCMGDKCWFKTVDATSEREAIEKVRATFKDKAAVITTAVVE